MNLRRSSVCALVAAACLLSPSLVLADPVVGQIDTFEDGTTHNWHVGEEAPLPFRPVNVPTGGPAGAGDHYLQLTARGGNGPGSKLSVINESQWTGNYLASGIDAITMDLRNFGPSDLYLRLLFVGPFGPMGPTSLALSTHAIFLPAASSWTPVTFQIGARDLTAGFGSITEALSSASELRLFHNPDPSFVGPGGNAIPSVQVTLGVDNIRAVPEPSTMSLLAIGALGALGLIRRRRA